jgi:uncharacterized protein (TIGR02246 family)
MTAQLWEGAVIKLTFVMAASALLFAAAAGAAPAPAPAAADQLAIQQLMARYEWALDSGDAKAYASLFADDGVLAFAGGEQKGRAAIQKSIEDLVKRFSASAPTGAPPRRIQHILSNLVIEQHGDAAEAKAFWTEIWNPTGKAMGVRAAGHYEDRLVKKGGQWWFARRQIFDDFPEPAATP